MSLYKALRNIFPDTYSTFKYLTRNNDYHFSEWSATTENQIYLYYWFYAKDKNWKKYKEGCYTGTGILIKSLYSK